MDDTLLNEHHQMTDRTIATLRRLVAQGVKVIFASGRSAAAMRPYVRQVGTPGPIIAANGAQIVDPITNEILSSDEIPLALAKDVLRWLEAKGVYAQYYDGDDWFYAAPHHLADEYSASSGVVGTLAGMPLYEHIQRPSAKLLGIDTPERAREIIQESHAVFGDRLCFTTSKPFFVEISTPAATKGNALKKLAGMIGLAPGTTLCCGDSLNDLTMLAWSTRPVAVGNARPEVKEIAWRIAGEARRDGIAILLDELIPEGTPC